MPDEAAIDGDSDERLDVDNDFEEPEHLTGRREHSAANARQPIADWSIPMGDPQTDTDADP